MKVTYCLPEEKKPALPTLADMKDGQFAVEIEGGRIYLATAVSALCLQDPGRTYSGNRSLRNGKCFDGRSDVVKILPPGTVITIVVE